LRGPISKERGREGRGKKRGGEGRRGKERGGEGKGHEPPPTICRKFTPMISIAGFAGCRDSVVTR